MGPRCSYRWKPPADLHPGLSNWGSSELKTLRAVWLEQKASLEDKGLVGEFTQKLLREMAIEGGILERAYTLDRGTIIALIENGIDASLIAHHSTNKDPNLVAAMIQDHLEAAEGVFHQIHDGRGLSTSFVKQLHSVLMRNQATTQAVDQFENLREVELLRGEYKRLPNNPRRPDGAMHEYCPREHVASEMDRLMDLHDAHVKANVPPEIEAAWLHHAFTQIHPFQDGNGRVARLLASYVFIRENCFPLVLVDERDRVKYIDALERADQSGDLLPLVQLFSTVQRMAFVKALGIAGETQRGAELDQIIDAAWQAEKVKVQQQRQKTAYAKDIAKALQVRADSRLRQIQQKLQSKFAPLDAGFQFFVDGEKDDGDRRHYFRRQIIETAKKLDYFANPGAYHGWVRLVLQTGDRADLLISFHVPGPEFRGLVVATGIFFRRSQTDTEVTEVTGAIPTCEVAFQMNYLDDERLVTDAFDLWLEAAIAAGLSLWQAGL